MCRYVLFEKIPGLVVDVDDGEIEVKCFHKNGHNRFFWLRIEDKIWYSIPQGTENNSDADGIPDDPAACINRYVVVQYDGEPFPGLVVDVDDGEIEVKCLHKNGHNRFFWPRIEDKIWYSMDQLVAIIPEPQSVTQRHVQVDPPIWEAILKKLT